jgi:hypothetical protein
MSKDDNKSTTEHLLKGVNNDSEDLISPEQFLELIRAKESEDKKDGK